MPTNKVALRSVEELMSDYVPVYQPLYPLFLTKSQQYEAEVGNLVFRRVTAVGDIRAKQITPKDTEIKQVSVMEGRKTYKKYFLANQFRLSNFQDREGVEEIQSQVLDEHQIHQDELFLLGEGTSNSTMLNNGLYWSADANYTLETSTEIDSTDRLYDFHASVMTTAQKANQVAGRKVVIFYGSSILPLANSLFPTSALPFLDSLEKSLNKTGQYSTIQLPEACTPSGANGWIIANLDQVKTHYTVLPEILDQGINAENMYAWTNFVQGSMMLEVLAPNAVIRQPATLE